MTIVADSQNPEDDPDEARIEEEGERFFKDLRFSVLTLWYELGVKLGKILLNSTKILALGSLKELTLRLGSEPKSRVLRALIRS